MSNIQTKKIDAFVKKLQARNNSTGVYNPYKIDKLAHNLKIYLNYLYETNQTDILLIGEAPGYKGCRHTGIPFTSEKLFEEQKIKFFKDMRKGGFQIDLNKESMFNENTATIMWKYLKNKQQVPILWNSFAFHPYKKYKQKSNRAPNTKEIKEGEKYIQDLVEIFEPKIIAAIGRKGQQALQKIYPDSTIHYIRHPSYGGKKDFLKQMDEIFQ